jgi:hypothetical protein
MKTISAVSLAILGVFSVDAAERPGKIVSHGMTFENGVTVHIDVVAEPPVPQNSSIQGTGINYSDGKLHRYIWKDHEKIYFGYDLTAEPLPDGTIRVNIDPLSLSVDELNEVTHLKQFSSYRPVIPRCPYPQIVKDGDTIAFDILVSPDGKQKIVDYLEFSRKH